MAPAELRSAAVQWQRERPGARVLVPVCGSAHDVALLANAGLAAPIRVHPRNPHWFEWRGKAVALITSAEHYGLFRSYLSARHTEGGMIDMNILDFTLMIEDSHVDTELVEYRRRSTEPQQTEP